MDLNRSPSEAELVRDSGLFDADWYRIRYPDVTAVGLDPLEHFMWLGWRLHRSPGPNFDMREYLRRVPEARTTQMNPVVFHLMNRQTLNDPPAPLFEVLPGVISKGNGKKILLCGHAAGDMLFGGERSLLDIIKALSELNLDLYVTLPSTDNHEYVESIKRFSVGVIKVPPHGWRHDQENLPLIALFEHIIKSIKIDLVYVNTIMLRAPQIAAQACGVKSLCHVRELIEQDSHLSERIALPAADIIADVIMRSTAIIGNSKATAKAFACQDVFIIPNTVDPQSFDIENEIGGRVKFGIISSNLPKKGITDFIEVARICHSRGLKAEFIIIGPSNDFIDNLCRQGLPPNILFAGYAASPQDALRQINVLVSLSHFAESFGRTVAEALAARRPAIAYDWGAISELITNGQNGYLAPYKDIDAVVKTVEKIVKDPQQILSLGERGRAGVEAQIAPQIYSGKLHDCIRAVLGSVQLRNNAINRRVTIIVPVYNAPDDVGVCLNSLARWTDLHQHRVLIIDDASPDAAVAPTLQRFASQNGFHILTNPENLGYTRTINKGIDWAADDDVVLLNSDTIVTPRWLEGLIETAQTADDIGTVTAMSDNAGAFSFPVPHRRNDRPAEIAPDAWAMALIRQAQGCGPLEVPTGNGFCLFIRRQVFEQIGVFDAEKFPRGYGEENEFSQRALARGWRHLIATTSYVYHERSKSFGSEREKLASEGGAIVAALYPTYMAKVKKAFSSVAMKQLRETMSQTAAQNLRERAAASDDQLRLSLLGEELVNWETVAMSLSTRRNDCVSIVICAYNNAGLTKRCLDSILRASANTEFEIILVDNGSDSNSFSPIVDFVRSQSKVKLISNPANYNFAIGNNIGFAASKGSRVVFLNNDTEVFDGWLDPLLGALEDPSVIGAQPKLIYPDGNIQCAGVVFSGRSPLGYSLYADVPHNDFRSSTPRFLRAVTAACLAVRARDFAGARGFDSLFINGQEDVDLCLRLGLGKNRFLYVPDSVVTHHEGKTTGRGKHVLANRRVFSARWADRFPGDDVNHYRVDGIQADDYFVDRPELTEEGIGLWRPRTLKPVPKRGSG